jgi:hypothetical protein
MASSVVNMLGVMSANWQDGGECFHACKVVSGLTGFYASS